jgi:hypothetical protein
MSDLITQTARLIPYAKRPKQGSGFVTAYVHEPPADDPGSPLGNLYIVMEALVSGRTSEDVTDLVIETFGDHYYNHGSEQPSAIVRFEQAVKATNHELAEFVDRGNAAWIGKISCVIAVVVDNEVHVAHAGSGGGLLYRGKSSSRITSDDGNRPATPTKTFASIASGELEPGDKLLLCTPALVHQVPLTKLTSVIGGSSPNAAISELTGLLKGSTERIAAIITEVTTPELAALQFRPQEPDEIKLGAPENPIQAAKIAAAPIADTTLQSGKDLAGNVREGATRIKPIARRVGLLTTAAIRRVLSTGLGRKLTMLTVVAGIGVVIALMVFNHQSTQQAKLFEDYQQLYRSYSTAVTNTNEDNTRQQLTTIQQRLTTYKASESKLNTLLANRQLLDGEPTTYDGFVKTVAAKLDELNGLIAVDGTTVLDLKVPGQTSTILELGAGKAYVVQFGNKPSLSTTNLTTRASKTSTKLQNLSGIKATTITPSGDALYLMTEEPALWLYRPNTDSLTKQTVSFGTWPKSAAIGTYLGNIYILSDNSIFKFVHAAVGFAPRTLYSNLAGTQEAGASSIAVDGAIYTVNSEGLSEFMAGRLTQTAKHPQPFKGIEHLRSVGSGKVLTAVHPESNRVLVWTRDTKDKLAFAKQISIKGVKKLQDAVYDNRTATLYILADDRLIKATPKL